MLIAILIFSILAFVMSAAWTALILIFVIVDDKEKKLKQKEVQDISVNTALTKATKEQLENALKNNEFFNEDH